MEYQHRFEISDAMDSCVHEGALRREPTDIMAEHSADGELAPPSRRIQVPAGQTVYFAGDPAEHYFQVENGCLCAEKIFFRGRRQITGLFHSGEYLGLVNSGIHRYSGEALCDCVLLKYRQEDLRAWLVGRPTRVGWLLDSINQEANAFNVHSLILGCRPPMERFATFLLLLVHHQERACEPGVVRLYMTREKIGNYLGLCMESVSRCVSRLRSLGIVVAVKPYQLVVRDRDALISLANEDILQQV